MNNFVKKKVTIEFFIEIFLYNYFIYTITSHIFYFPKLIIIINNNKNITLKVIG